MVDFAASDRPTPDETLERIVRCIREVVEPDLILLFGSRASGDARDDSDYDLMLVLPDESVLEASRTAVRNRLSELRISADVLARTPAQYERNQRDPGFLDFIVSREGRLLYATGRIPQRSRNAGRVREDPPAEGLEMWIRRAESDLRNAEQSLVAPVPTWDAICFHAHACVEKLLKAMIVRAGAFPPRSHDLKVLLEMQPADVRDDATISAACELLMTLLPKARYPELPEPTPDEAREAITAARQAREILASALTRR